MLYTSEGIVLHTIKYGESSRIVQIYTEKNGLISLMAQGFKSKSNIKKIHFQSLNILNINYYYKPKNTIHRLKEARLLNGSSSEGNFNKLSVQVFISELLYKSIQEEERNNELYIFIKEWIANFHNQQTLNINSHLVFTLKLSKYLGFFPNINDKEGIFFNLRHGILEEKYNKDQTLTEEESKILCKFIIEEEVKSNKNRKMILNILMEYYKHHIERFNEMKSKSILEEVLY